MWPTRISVHKMLTVYFWTNCFNFQHHVCRSFDLYVNTYFHRVPCWGTHLAHILTRTSILSACKDVLTYVVNDQVAVSVIQNKHLGRDTQRRPQMFARRRPEGDDYAGVLDESSSNWVNIKLNLVTPRSVFLEWKIPSFSWITHTFLQIKKNRRELRGYPLDLPRCSKCDCM